MPIDAPYTGGTEVGGRLFAVDGDFTIGDPCGPPEIYNPFIGDSQPSIYPIVLLDRTLTPPDYVSVAVGRGFNLQDFAANQQAIIIEQEFMVAEEAHIPLPLNTPYNILWSLGWSETYAGLGACFLVEESPLISVGGGIAKIKRKFANLPPNRNERESYAVTFPALNYGGNSVRFGTTKIVETRLFFEFFVFDNLGLLTIPLFPAGHRIITTDLGTDEQFLIFEQFQGFKAEASAVATNNILDSDQAITNGPPATTPSYTTYQGWMGTAEIVAEASSFNRWMGNIFVRRTRFAVAQ